MKNWQRAAAAVLTAATCLPAQDTKVLEVTMDETTVVELVCRTRHTTVIRLPADEGIADAVLGDSEYWAVQLVANLAYLKPAGAGVETNLALVTRSGRVYSFTARERSNVPPHLAVFVSRAVDPDAPEAKVGSPIHVPAFVARAELEVFEEDARAAREQLREATQAALAAQEEGIEEFRLEYPRTMRFPYRLEAKAREWPFVIEGMWHDGRHTFIRSNAPEAPAVYEKRAGQPSMVSYELRDGLYVIGHVVGPGYFQLGKDQRRWFIDDPDTFALQIAEGREAPRP